MDGGVGDAESRWCGGGGKVEDAGAKSYGPLRSGDERRGKGVTGTT